MEAQIFANPFSLLLKIKKFNLIDSFKGVHKICKWRYNNSEKITLTTMQNTCHCKDKDVCLAVETVYLDVCTDHR